MSSNTDRPTEQAGQPEQAGQSEQAEQAQQAQQTQPTRRTETADARPAAAHREPTPEDFVAVHRSDEFRTLRRSFRGFAFPMTIAFFVWYFGYVLLSTYAEGFMSLTVVGNLNVGLVLGLSQFVMTFLITWLYIRHANKSLDPISSKLRVELEGEY